MAHTNKGRKVALVAGLALALSHGRLQTPTSTIPIMQKPKKGRKVALVAALALVVLSVGVVGIYWREIRSWYRICPVTDQVEKLPPPSRWALALRLASNENGKSFPPGVGVLLEALPT